MERDPVERKRREPVEREAPARDGAEPGGRRPVASGRPEEPARRTTGGEEAADRRARRDETERRPLRDRTGAWLERLETSRAAPAPGPTPGNGFGGAPGLDEEATELLVERLREQAARMAREDAAAGVPKPDATGPSGSERDLAERCRAHFDRWRSHTRRRLHERASEAEERISDKLERASLSLDRFERVTNELVRLKARLSLKRREVASELSGEKAGRRRGIPTKIYAAAIGFLGLVEFFANAPVFSALLPRDPLTERQIRLVAETSEGWIAGAQRVFSHLILRPDATLLAMGVVTFLCVLAHFFGHSLREYVMQRDRSAQRHTVTGRSRMENVVPMVLGGLGLALVLGVLYEARVTLGEVGEQQYAQDMTVVEEFRRNAGWLRADGDLLAANEATNRADDMEGAANELREYAASMSRLSFPILLLNLTLVLCAISAAYFHRQDARREHFNESPFEDERRDFIGAAEDAAQEVAAYLSELTRHIRELKTLTTLGPEEDARGMVHQLETVITLYRAENGRARGIDPRGIPAFTEPVRLGISLDGADGAGLRAPEPLRPPEDYERERQAIKARFEEVRKRFNEEAMAW